MKKGKLIVLSGFSGSGKGTVVNGLLNKYDDYAISISATTRKPREGEVEGVHYYFKTPEEFQTMVDNDEFIEHATFVENSYGTPKAFVENKLNEGINVILEIEVQGALKVKEKMPETEMVFIIPPTAKILKDRLVGRGTESLDVVLGRLRRAIDESDFIKHYDYVIINDDINECIINVNDTIHGNIKETENIITDKKVIDEFADNFKNELSGLLEGE